MKKTNKIFALLLVVAMVCMLGITAFADGPTYDAEKGAVTGGTASSPAQGYLSKVLQMPEGTNTPASEFTFDWVQKTSGEGISSVAADVTKLEKSDGVGKLTYSTSDTGTTTEGIKKVVKSYMFADVSAFTKAGRYQFDVEEHKNTNSAIDAAEDQTLTYAPEKYLVTIDVANADDGSLYIKNIAVQKYENNGTLGDKVNPGQNGAGEGNGSEFNFTNTFVKNLPTDPDGKDPTGEDPTEDNKGLYIQKTVVKNTADEALADSDKATPFTFSVTVTKPSLSTKEKYTAKVVKTGDAAQSVSIATETYEFDVTSGSATQTVTLKHGQRLVFEDLDVGAKYTVSETADASYSTTVVKTSNGVEAQSAETLTVATTNITEGKDSASYTNTRKTSDTPTGILMNNLPYIILLILAGGGLTAYVVSKRREQE